MIVVEKHENFIRTYSDSNKYIRKVITNEIYLEAIDVLEFKYVETDIEIETYEEYLDEPIP